MRTLLLGTLLAVLVLAAYGGYRLYASFQPAAFEYRRVELPAQLPPAQPPPQMSVSVLRSGQMYSQQAFAFRGGAFDVEQISAMDALLVRHPQGDLLIDTGFGRDLETHIETTPLLLRLLARYDTDIPVADRLKAQDYDFARLAGILLTHAHWDHVSGIPDLPGVPVWVNRTELDFIREGGELTALARSFTDVDYQLYAFSDGPYLGYSRSFDVYGDGSIVLVLLGGHTPGSTGVFITLPSGRRLMMVGDLVWAREGIEGPAERPWASRRMVDHAPGRVRQELGRLHQIHQRFPDILMVPAHDRRVFESLAQYPRRTQ